MASEDSGNIGDGEQDVSKGGGSTPMKKPGSKAQGRKRTKTGCLTCRKRRIKCSEEKPVCTNCIKSKRQCEGYNQRVVFKDPLSLYRPSLSTPSRGSFHTSVSAQLLSSQANSSGRKPIAPKPFRCPVPVPEVASAESIDKPVTAKGRSQSSTPSHDLSSIRSDSTIICPTRAYTAPQVELGQPRFGNNVKQEMVPDITSSPDTLSLWQTESNGNSEVASDTFQGVHEDSNGISNSKQPAIVQETPMDWDDDLDDPFDISDDDTTMGEYGHDSGQYGVQDEHPRSHDLGIVIALQANQNNQALSLRSYTSFIDRPDMLADYIPATQSSPLRDPMTARIFCHFVNVTGPSISMYERQLANPSLIFQGAPVPKSQQHIWTYTFPAMSLHSPAILHAMLALGSIHIAKLQNTSTMPSMKHYAIGLRRVAKLLSSDTRRRQPATLAAAMLLAFYECAPASLSCRAKQKAMLTPIGQWSADHQKWSNHLLGAKQLVREVDFAGMTKHLRNRRKARHLGISYELDSYNDQREVDHSDIDEGLVGVLMGIVPHHDEYGKVIDDENPTDDWRGYTEKDLGTYETQRDLFWWYCKQDVYQSILGGGRLFLDYALWSICPPRAPVGRLDAVYGTFDHMMLLYGRLAAFAANDLKRKRLAIKANGGSWQPPEATRNNSNPQSTGNQDPSPPPRQMPQMPPFSGMVPGVQEVKLPLGFEQTRDRDGSPQSTEGESIDLPTQTREAEEEWKGIKNAFDVLQERFGDDFQALGPEFSPAIPTPFGPALQYRTYGIAGIWMNFYMALIFLYRVHPSMPPAAMVAAAVAARQTIVYGTNVGRIAAGIAPHSNMATEVNPGIGAALMESATCLFVAGVQYQDSEQRSFTVKKLGDIARLTGWQTALAIAAGCETSWVKAGELGRGPIYKRTGEEKKVTDIGTSSRRIDRAFSGKSVEERRMVLEKSDRVHYALGVLGLHEDFEKLDIENVEQGGNERDSSGF